MSNGALVVIGQQQITTSAVVQIAQRYVEDLPSLLVPQEGPEGRGGGGGGESCQCYKTSTCTGEPL